MNEKTRNALQMYGMGVITDPTDGKEKVEFSFNGTTVHADLAKNDEFSLNQYKSMEERIIATAENFDPMNCEEVVKFGDTIEGPWLMQAARELAKNLKLAAVTIVKELGVGFQEEMEERVEKDWKQDPRVNIRESTPKQPDPSLDEPYSFDDIHEILKNDYTFVDLSEDLNDGYSFGDVQKELKENRETSVQEVTPEVKSNITSFASYTAAEHQLDEQTVADYIDMYLDQGRDPNRVTKWIENREKHGVSPENINRRMRDRVDRYEKKKLDLEERAERRRAREEGPGVVDRAKAVGVGVKDTVVGAAKTVRDLDRKIDEAIINKAKDVYGVAKNRFDEAAYASNQFADGVKKRGSRLWNQFLANVKGNYDTLHIRNDVTAELFKAGFAFSTSPFVDQTSYVGVDPKTGGPGFEAHTLKGGTITSFVKMSDPIKVDIPRFETKGRTDATAPARAIIELANTYDPQKEYVKNREQHPKATLKDYQLIGENLKHVANRVAIKYNLDRGEQTHSDFGTQSQGNARNVNTQARTKRHREVSPEL